MFLELLVVILHMFGVVIVMLMPHLQEESKFRTHNESDSNVDVEIVEEITRIDDDEVDDFGEPSEAHESGIHKRIASFVMDDLVLEDFI